MSEGELYAVPAGHTDRLRALKLSRYPEYPVIAWARERADTCRRRLQAGAAALDAMPASEGERRRYHRLIVALADEVFRLEMVIDGGLPDTDICVCRRCKRVLLPRLSWSSYRCDDCSMFWGFTVAANFKPLPFDFWIKYMPGDTYRGRLDVEQLHERSRKAFKGWGYRGSGLHDLDPDDLDDDPPPGVMPPPPPVGQHNMRRKRR